MKRYLFPSILLIMIVFSCSRKDTPRLFVGGATGEEKNGLYLFDFNNRKGTLELVSFSDAGPSPFYLCYNGSKELLYALNEVKDFNGTNYGGITTLKYNEKEGSLEKLNEFPVPNGGPCFISVSPDNGHLFVANYPRGCVAVVRLGSEGIPEKITDTIYYSRDTTEVSHAHMIMDDPSGNRIYVTDLGLDRIIVYGFDSGSGKLIPHDTVNVEKGAGPRHFVFNNSGSRLYVINELGSKMMVFDIKKGEKPQLLQTLTTYRDGFTGKNFCADVHISSDGKYLYGSNRGENTIVTFLIGDDGMLTVQGHTSCGGDWPRNFCIDPSGKFIIAGNQRSDSISVFRINPQNGLPEKETGKYRVPGPACLKFF